MRIWFQRHTSVGKLASVDRNYAEHARKLLRPDTTIEFRGVPKDVYENSFPNEVVKYTYAEFLFTNYFLSRVIEAEKSGYDAFIIGTATDIGLREARTLVDIPVVAYSEASLHVGCMLGSRVSFIGFVHATQDRYSDNARIYGLHEKVGPMGRVPATAAMVQDAFEGNAGPFIDAFMKTARDIIAQGTDVMIPNEGLTNEILFHNGIFQVDGVPIVDSNGLTFKMAETMADLRRTSGMMTTRKGHFYARPPAELVERLRSFYGTE